VQAQVPSHFSSIGIPVSNQEEFVSVVEELAKTAATVQFGKHSYLRWTSRCGAEVWLQTNAVGQIIGANPYFSGESSVRVGITSRIIRDTDSELDGAFHGWANPVEQDATQGDYPFVFDVVDNARYGRLQLPSVAESQIAAFSHEVTTYVSVDEFTASQTGDIKFASQSFIPSGLFSPEGESTNPPQANAIFAGHILDAKTKTNDFSGETYYWALVDTLGGRFDVVIDPSLSNLPPMVGGVLSGSFWLSGRLIRFAESKPSLWSRLLGK
jgi:hypothetical protein